MVPRSVSLRGVAGARVDSGVDPLVSDPAGSRSWLRWLLPAIPIAAAFLLGLTQIDDPDAFTHTLSGASVEYLPLGHGTFSAALTLMTLGGLQLQHASIPPTVTRGSIGPKSTILLFPVTPNGAPVVNGALVDEAHVTIMRPGSEIHAIVRSRLTWASVALDAHGQRQGRRRCPRRADAAQYFLGRRDGRCRHRQPDAGGPANRHRLGDAVHGPEHKVTQEVSPAK